MVLLSIVIVTYNALQDIFQCIDSIYQYSDLKEEEFEIIIVDNSSLEVFNEMSFKLREVYGSKIQIKKNSENKGYGQGNNTGIKLASGRYICIANPDILFKAPMFKEVLKLFANDQKLAMIGGKQIGGRNSSFLNRPEYDFFVLMAPLSDFLNKLNIYIQKYFYLSGALLFVDKNKFFEIGLFDEEMFLYYEESDITKRFLEKNYTTKFVKEFIYDHLVEDRGIATERTFGYEIDSVKKYLHKHQYSLTAFLNNKIISYRIMIFIYFLIGKKQKGEKSKIYLKRYLMQKKNINTVS